MITRPARTGILLAAFGSSSPLGEKALGRFAQQVRTAFPGLPVRWAYTSGLIRTRLAAAGKKTDSVKKALCRMGFEHYTHVAVQSLHLIPGVEYEALLEETRQAREQGGPAHIAVGLPLLYEPQDVQLAVRALLAHLPPQRTAKEPVICMGHGTWHAGAAGYQALADCIAVKDPRIFIGALEGEHALTTLLPTLQALFPPLATAGSPGAAGSPDAAGLPDAADAAVPPGNRGTAWLLPLLSIIGKHAEQDMAGTHPLSWRSRIEAAGFHCRPVLKGTVEYAGFADIWLRHLAVAVKDLRSGKGGRV